MGNSIERKFVFMEGLKNRAVALIVCVALILVGWFGGSAVQNMSSKLITVQAAGVKANTVVLQVGGRDVTAGEYLYWLASSCDAIYQYYGITDWTLAMTQDLTVGDYAKEQADYYVSQRAAIELLAAEQGVTLDQTQQEQLDGIGAYYTEYYGSGEVYQYLLDYAGLDEKLLKTNSAVPYLYTNLCAKLLGTGGALEPTEENLRAYAERNGYTELSDGELLMYYQDTDYGVVYDYVNDYIDSLEIVKTEAYDAIDVAAFYPALMAAREALPMPETDNGSAEE